METDVTTDAVGIAPRQNEMQPEDGLDVPSNEVVSPHSQKYSTKTKEETLSEQEHCQSQKENLSATKAEATSGQMNSESPQKLHNASAERQSENDVEIVSDPPTEWRLNNLIDEITPKISIDELNRLKKLFRGNNGIGKAVLNKCDTVDKFFDVLRERNYISKGNVTYLNRFIYVLDRRDLLDIVVKYCEDEKNVVHYYPVTDEPEPGMQHVKFHIVADVKDCNQERIDRLKNNVAKIVCAPVEQVRLVGVEPGSSLLITLLMSDMYVEILEQMIYDNKCPWELTAVGVDIVVVHNKPHHVTGPQHYKMKESEQLKSIMTIYKQFEEKNSALEKVELELFTVKDEMIKLKGELKRKEDELKTGEIVGSVFDNIPSISLDDKVARREFCNAMRLAKLSGQDMHLLKQIVESNSQIVKAYTIQETEAKVEKQNALLQEKKAAEMQLLHDFQSGSKSAKETICLKCKSDSKWYSYSSNIQSISEDAFEALRRESESLTDEERIQLIHLYNWREDDVIKACIEAVRGLLLFGLMCKQFEVTRVHVETESFLLAAQKEISRSDLDVMYRDLLEDVKKTRRMEEEQNLLGRLSSKSQTPEEILRLKLSDYIIEGKKITISDVNTKKMISLSKHLNEEEKSKLMQRYDWTDSDVIKKCVDANENLVVFGFMCKEIEISQIVLKLDPILKRIQRELNRRDLLNLYEHISVDEDENKEQLNSIMWKQKKETMLFKKLLSKQKTPEEILVFKYRYCTMRLDDVLALDEYTNHILKTLSWRLLPEEAHTLLSKFVWTKNDLIKACIETDKQLLMLGLECKEVEETQSYVNRVPFLTRMLKEVDRMDLVDLFIENSRLPFQQRDVTNFIDVAKQPCMKYVKEIFVD